MIQIAMLKSSPPDSGYFSPGTSARLDESGGSGKSFQEYLERLGTPEHLPPGGEPAGMKEGYDDSYRSPMSGPAAERSAGTEESRSGKLEKYQERDPEVKTKRKPEDPVPAEAEQEVEKEVGQEGAGEAEKLAEADKTAEESASVEEELDKGQKASGKVFFGAHDQVAASKASSTRLEKGRTEALKQDTGAEKHGDTKGEEGKRGVSGKESPADAAKAVAKDDASNAANRNGGADQLHAEPGDSEGTEGVAPSVHPGNLSAEAAAVFPEGARSGDKNADAAGQSGKNGDRSSLAASAEGAPTRGGEKSGKDGAGEIRVIDLREKSAKNSGLKERPSVRGKGELEESPSLRMGNGTAGMREGAEAAKAQGLLTDSAESADSAESKGDVKFIHIDAGLGKDGTSAFENDRGTTVKEAAAALGKRFDQDVSGKLVKEASIVLKDQRSGEIRLVLHPEKLGKVRIQLQLEDNRIAGRIFVDNTSVRDLFESNVKNLARAFAEEGFDQTRLDVFVGSRDSGKGKEGAGESRRSFHSGDSRMAVNRLETSVPLLNQYGREDTIIDLVV